MRRKKNDKVKKGIAKLKGDSTELMVDCLAAVMSVKEELSEKDMEIFNEYLGKAIKCDNTYEYSVQLANDALEIVRDKLKEVAKNEC